MEKIIYPRDSVAAQRALACVEETGPVDVYQILLSRPWYQNRHDPEGYLRKDYDALLKEIQARQLQQGLAADQFPSFSDLPRMPRKLQDVYSAISHTLAAKYLSFHPEFANARIVGSNVVEEYLRQAFPSVEVPFFNLVPGGFVLHPPGYSGPLFGFPDLYLAQEDGVLTCVDYSTKIDKLWPITNQRRMGEIKRTFTHRDSSSLIRSAIAAHIPNACYDDPTQFEKNTLVVALDAPSDGALAHFAGSLSYGQFAPASVRARGYMALQAIEHIVASELI